MKSVISVFIMIIFVIGGWFFSYKYIENNSLDFIHSLNIMSKNIKNNDWKNSQNEFLKMKEKWVNIKNTLDLIIDRKEIESVNLIIKKINTYMDLKNVDLTLNEITVLKEIFRIMIEKESIKLTNIL
ncbi:DUF4363 family protein [Tepidibacter thalassicus]|uniref:DUF4363 domain-containing protein n=1 Tax=Tepidibacter thalassicus DSM 15285 TaxID=1123350 RepID=A0A1M5P0D3_9FIRM|nr:DUF4363 family protein [Tepidibacter thalassicus]SHG95294.1 protein of unknown function [Tepidibacter thalassicus DSM 15285]